MFLKTQQKKCRYKINKSSNCLAAYMHYNRYGKNGDDILRIMDESIYEEVVYRYHDLIDMYTEKFSFITKVIYDYSDFKSNRIRSERFLDFIEKSWELYKEDFALADDDVELEKVLIQVILYTILKNRLTIKKIKEGVGL